MVFSGVTRHSDTSSCSKRVSSWRESCLAASRIEYMAKAIDPSGSVDQTRWLACNTANIINMCWLIFGVEHLPSKTVCPTPRIYPGSTSYNEEVSGKLPSGLTVRHPTSCPCSIGSCPGSPYSSCSSVDLNKLHFDQSRPGSTGIKVCGETLTMKVTLSFLRCHWMMVLMVKEFPFSPSPFEHGRQRYRHSEHGTPR